MGKKLIFLFAFILITVNSFANNINVTIQINGVNVGGGLLYVAVYSNETGYKNKQAFVSFTLNPDNTRLNHSLELPEGEYVVSIFQDTNNDGRLNKAIFGIPTEPVGITNYNHRGAPGNFNKLKIPVNSNSTTIIVNMGRVRPL
ncbi:MAG: DUF2141 domain-containing protein [Treponema sp.]|jgi:uncharacterized protein (DUF2141 family)|nr:DUF2141 domain-containing protein [Treponema sp.]